MPAGAVPEGAGSGPGGGSRGNDQRDGQGPSTDGTAAERPTRRQNFAISGEPLSRDLIGLGGYDTAYPKRNDKRDS